MAYALLQASQSYPLTNAVLKYVPSNWTKMPQGKEMELVNLPAVSTEYKNVTAKIKLTIPDIVVKSVKRVQNPYLWGAFLLKKKEGGYVQEFQLFHATAELNVSSISSDNFDWRRTVRSKFGKGVSFSPSAFYADKYCNMSAGSCRALILTRVLVNKCTAGNEHTELPTVRYDTTTGNGNKVYVKFCDNEFYPEYVAYYNSRCTYGHRKVKYHFGFNLMDNNHGVDDFDFDDDNGVDDFDFDVDDDNGVDDFDIYDDDYGVDDFDIFDDND